VPLHRWRLLSRRFNQAALLAHGIAARSGVTCIPDLLIRRRNTPSQGKLTAAGRARNVAGAFAVNPVQADALQRRRVVLVDDVLTTGATAESCAGALLRGGAAAVDVLTLARVVRPSYI
jgi:ComF family protein